MQDRSSRPHRSPNRTPQALVRKVVHLRWKKRLGPVAIGGRLGMPASTVHAVLVRCRLNRLRHVDSAPGNRSAATSTTNPGSMIHVDVKKLGNIPDGGGWRTVGRQQGNRNRAATPGKDRNKHHERADAARVRAHRHRRPLPRRVRRDPRRRDRRHRDRRAPPGGVLVRSPRRHRRTGAVRQRRAYRSPTRGGTRAPSSASARREPAPTGRRQTARSNASTAPSPTAGRSAGTTTPNQPAATPCPRGCITTITTGPTPPSARSHPSPG